MNRPARFGTDIVLHPSDMEPIPSILLVDDDEVLREMTRTVLEANGYAVTTTASVSAAEAWCEGHTPELIISDVEMPGANGFDFYRSVHTRPAMHDVPFIFLSGHGDIDTVTTGKELGSDDYFTKPVNYPLLLATIKGKMKKRRMVQQKYSTQVEQIKGELFRMISHEMRTPLTTILGATEILADPTSNLSAEDLTGFLTMLQQNSVRLTSMFEDFLTVTRIESGDIATELPDEPLPFSPRSTAEAALYRMQERAAGRSVRLESNVPPGDVIIPVYPPHLENILVRLLDNAVKFSPRGATVAVAGSVAPDLVTFSVSDDGPGIAPEHVPAIFDKFYQADREHQEQQGAGLGLFIARRLAELNGGTLGVDSAPGRGSVFTLRFPRP